jgi:hypothetical protein
MNAVHTPALFGSWINVKNLPSFYLNWLRSSRFSFFTYSMEQSPSWAANRFSPSQEIPLILWITKVPYRIYKCPPPGPVLSQINPAYGPHPTSWRSILILSSHLRMGLPRSLFPSGFPTKTLYTPPLCLHTFYVPRPSPRFYHPKNIEWSFSYGNFRLYVLLIFPIRVTCHTHLNLIVVQSSRRRVQIRPCRSPC